MAVNMRCTVLQTRRHTRQRIVLFDHEYGHGERNVSDVAGPISREIRLVDG